MAKGSSPPSPGSPATAGGSPAGSPNSASERAVDVNANTAHRVQFEDDDARGQGSDEEYEEKEEVDDDVKLTAELLSEVDELSLRVSRMGIPRPVECNLVAELNASADEDEEEQGAAQGERPPLIPRATRNADTPSANKVLARLGEEV
ncbi:hypothetical protein PF011_g25600 [Phytophthora fragariae]|uniref:Uncharacterized protein n=1 Tax=Phytophthora fragariae TaxID=53985 RepID=A0A6A3HPQ6_9STRA|nr:hypothetical protein PF011_g25600 [Phytophthora fragariae]